MRNCLLCKTELLKPRGFCCRRPSLHQPTPQPRDAHATSGRSQRRVFCSLFHKPYAINWLRADHAWTRVKLCFRARSTHVCTPRRPGDRADCKVGISVKASRPPRSAWLTLLMLISDHTHWAVIVMCVCCVAPGAEHMLLHHLMGAVGSKK